MSRTKIFLAVFSALVLATAVGLLQQRRASAELRRDISIAREAARDIARVQSNIDRLASQQPGETELAALRADRAALVRLRGEVTALREAANTAAVARVSTPKPSTPADENVFSERKKVPHEKWTNAGRDNPLAAFETLMWSAAHGDVDTLAQAAVIDSRWQYQVELLWASLPHTVREEYRTPERLFAAMTIRDVPIGTAQVNHHSQLKEGEHGLPGPGHALVIADVIGADKTRQRVSLYFRPSEHGWQLVIPGAAVSKYRDALKGKTPVIAETR